VLHRLTEAEVAQRHDGQQLNAAQAISADGPVTRPSVSRPPQTVAVLRRFVHCGDGDGPIDGSGGALASNRYVTRQAKVSVPRFGTFSRLIRRSGAVLLVISCRPSAARRTTTMALGALARA
jgi:hypothetical protein